LTKVKQESCISVLRVTVGLRPYRHHREPSLAVARSQRLCARKDGRHRCPEASYFRHQKGV